MKYDEYSGCTAGLQTGPEVIYRIEVKRACTLTVSVTEFKDEGIDNNVFLLRLLNVNEKHTARDCIAGDDREITEDAVCGLRHAGRK